MTDIAHLDTVICGDCLEVMKDMPDNCVDLVLTDPQYGIGADQAACKNKGKWGWAYYGESDWDKKRPDKVYFDEIIRISKNQVIWGGNYFADLLPPSMGWLIWNKCQRAFSLADAELAWTSYHAAIRTFDYSRGAAVQDGKVHPTQKPRALFKWIIEKFTEEGDVVCDPYLGSGTTGVACVAMGRHFIGIEINEAYCEVARKRIQAEREKYSLFEKRP